MQHLTFLQDLSVVMIVAAIVTVLFRQLKQPVVLGYILAGVIIGPYTPPIPLIADKHTIETLSELGVIFLMFSLGLEFSLRKLREVGATALIAASLEILVMLGVGYQLGRLFGWTLMDSVFLGAVLSISSTTIIIKALDELGKTKERFAELIFGILIVEDILAIVMIALLSGFATTGSFEMADVGETILRLSAFLGVLLIVGLIVVPRLLNYVSRFQSNEMLLITVIGLCFGVSLLAAKLGYSVALGAFLIGAIIAEARQIAKIEELTFPVRDLFSAVFFVSIGLLIDPALLVKYAGPILIVTAAVVAGKVVSCSCGAFLTGNDRRTSLRVGMGLAQIGEFSFIIAALGLSLKVTSDYLYPIAVAVSALTTLLTPYLIRCSDGVVEWSNRTIPRPLLNYLDTYTRWMSEFVASRDRGMAVGLLKKWSLQIGANLLLVTAVFIAAGFFKNRAMELWPTAPGGENGMKGILWLAAMIASLPMLIAVVRKWQAFVMLVAEISVPRAAGGEHTTASRAAISSFLLIAGGAGLLLVIILLSSTTLPPWNLLAGLVVILVLATIVLRRTFIRLHARAQSALQQTFAEGPAPRPHANEKKLPPLLQDAELATVNIDAESAAVGKLLAEVKLRTRTGASIVGIERNGVHIVNPPVDEELRAGDQVLLLGRTEQLVAARELLSAGKS